MASRQLRQQTSNCSLLLIYRPRKDERLSWPGWLTCSGLFTHKWSPIGYRSSTGQGQFAGPRSTLYRCATRGLSVGLFVTTMSPTKTTEPCNRDGVWVMKSGWVKEPLLDGYRSPVRMDNFEWEAAHCKVCTLWRELCKNGWTDRYAVWGMNSGGPKEACVYRLGAHWRHLTNTIEPSVCGGDAAFLWNYFDHVLLVVT